MHSAAPDFSSYGDRPTSIPTHPSSDVKGEKAQVVQRMHKGMDEVLNFEHMVERFENLPAIGTWHNPYISSTATLMDSTCSGEFIFQVQLQQALEWFLNLKKWFP